MRRRKNYTGEEKVLAEVEELILSLHCSDGRYQQSRHAKGQKKLIVELSQ